MKLSKVTQFGGPTLVSTTDGRSPSAGGSYLAPSATLVGSVLLGPGTSVWYGAVLRGDTASIRVESGSNIQDCCVVHADPGYPVRIGENVSVGHGAVLHGCTIADDVLVGMGAVIMNGAHVGSGSIVAAGAVVLENTVIPADSLATGMPARVSRGTSDDERAGITANAIAYMERARQQLFEV